MPLPKVSVLIPSYNHEKYVKEAIGSVLNQTFQDFELIITDDGSTDRTVDKIKEFDDERIQLYVFEENQGAPNAMNHCIKKAKGEYIAYVSSDDVWELDKLEKQVEFLDNNKDISVVFSRASIIGEDSKVLAGNDFDNDTYNFYKTIFNQANRYREEWLRRFFFEGNCICHPSMLIRKEVYGDVGLYDERLANLPDFDMWVRVCLNHEIFILDEELIRFRIRDNNANMSSGNEAPKRIKFEQKQILNHYLHINDVFSFLKVFPDSKKYGEVVKESIPYFLGRIAYDMESDVYKLWGLELIYGFMKSDNNNLILKNYDFEFQDFISMTASDDVFHIDEIATLISNIHVLNSELNYNNSHIQKLQNDIIENNHQIETQNEEIRNKDKVLEFQNEEINGKNEILESQNNKIKSQKNLLNKQKNLLNKQKNKIKEMESSTSWKITKPIRKIGNILRKIIYYPYLYIFLKSNIHFKELFRSLKAYNILKNSKMFNEKFYVKKYLPKAPEMNPIVHYIYFGVKEGKNPNKEFDTNFYLNKYKNVKKSKMNPLIHFILHGRKEGKIPNPETSLISESGLFDKKYYISNYGKYIKHPIKHYISTGAKKKFNPNPLFDHEWYLNNNINLKLKDGFLHFIKEGAKNKLDSHPMFSTEFYIKQRDQNGFKTITNYLLDYIEYGRFEGLIPSESFVIDEKIVSNLPNDYKYRYTSSPILCSVAPAIYLSPFFKNNLHHKFWDLESYSRLSILETNLIHGIINEEDMRIISIMDQEKRNLHDKYINETQDELVSIIMPTQNRSETIIDAIISVISQTYRNLELIIIDDGGIDNTEEIVSKFKDKRIKYFKSSTSQGASVSRNFGLSMSKGSIIAYLDDDDIWDPDMLLISVNEMRNSGKKIAYSAQMGWNGFNETSRLGNRFAFIRFTPFNRSLIENYNYISMISLIHDKSLFELFGGFDESLESLEDWDLVLKYTEAEFPKTIPCILSHYLMNRCENSTSAVKHTEINHDKIYQKLIERACYRSKLSINRENYPIFGISDITIQNRSNSPNIQDKTVEIIIPNYESKSMLEKCIESIIENTTVPHNILICDNNSSKNTQIFIDELCQKYENVEWIEVNENQGFSYSVNKGLEIAFEKKNDILILNNDVIVTPNWLEELLIALYENDDVGISVPRQVLFKGNKIISPHAPSAKNPFEVDINLSAHHHNILKPFDTDKFELNFAPLFCALVRYEDAVSVGYLDVENGPHFRSDNIYSEMLRRKTGKKIIYTPYSKVYHLQGISTDEFEKSNFKRL